MASYDNTPFDFGELESEAVTAVWNIKSDAKIPQQILTSTVGHIFIKKTFLAYSYLLKLNLEFGNIMLFFTISPESNCCRHLFRPNFNVGY